jgi:uncharacterized protein (DUF885 family)
VRASADAGRAGEHGRLVRSRPTEFGRRLYDPSMTDAATPEPSPSPSPPFRPSGGRPDVEAEVGDEGRALAELAERAWDAYLEAHPTLATSLGDRRFDAALRPNGPAALDDEERRLGDLISRTVAIDSTALTPEDRVTHAALLDFLGAELDHVASGVERWSVDPLDGPQVQLLNVASYQPVATPEQGADLVARWQEMGPWVDRLIDSTRSALGEGIAAPHALVRSVVAELDDLLDRPTETWPLLDPIRNVPGEWPSAERERFAASVRASVTDTIRPAFERYRSFLTAELAPAARDDAHAGLGAVAGGAETYERLVRAHTTLELAPREIHRIGLEETERIDEEFRGLGRRLLGTSELAAVLDRLRTEPALHFTTPEEVFRVAEASLARANAAIGDWFGRVPRTPCVVVEMGEHEAKHSTIAYYRQPAADGSRPGSYYINTTEPTTRPRYEAETLAFHEAVPGHHLQIAIAQELDGLPAFRRMAGPTAYIEGWGLYSERLSEEMGLLTSELDRFGILSFDAWRACRLVVDTGLHALGWRRDRAIEFMVEHTALARNNIVNEVDRYLAIPGQALAYKLGQREILALRDQARAGLGDAFDIRSFHDVVLGQGAVGLATLRRVVEAWIVAQRG